MTDIIVDGKTRVFAIPDTGLLTLSALSVANFATGEAIHGRLVPTGLEGFEGSTAEIDNTALDSTFDTRLPGRTSFSGTGLLLKKQDDAADDVFDLVTVKGTNLLIAIFDAVDADAAVAVTQDYEVYPVRTGEFNFVGRGEANSLLRYRVPTPIQAPRVRGTVGA